MSQRPLRFALTAAALAATLALAGCGSGEPAADQDVTEEEALPQGDPVPPPPPAQTPVSTASGLVILSVDVGATVDAHGQVLAPQATFMPADTVHVSFTTNTTPGDATVSGDLSAVWTFEDGKVVYTEGQAFSMAGPSAGAFELKKDEGLRPGKYTVDLKVDGQTVRSANFNVAQ